MTTEQTELIHTLRHLQRQPYAFDRTQDGQVFQDAADQLEALQARLTALEGQEAVAQKVNAGPDGTCYVHIRELTSIPIGAKLYLAAGAVPPASVAVPLDSIRGAVARGWCSPSNSHKEMDTTLALAIADEVFALFAAPQPPTSAKPLTDEQLLDAFCITPGIHQFIQAFKAGARYAEAANGIKEQP